MKIWYWKISFEVVTLPLVKKTFLYSNCNFGSYF